MRFPPAMGQGPRAVHGAAEMGQSRARSFSNLEIATQRNFMNSREEKGKLGAMRHEIQSP